jgi:uncharacterized protein YuzE
MFTYEKDTDCAYIHLVPAEFVVKPVVTTVLAPGILVDAERSGRVVGVEIVFLKQKMGLKAAPTLEKWFE